LLNPTIPSAGAGGAAHVPTQWLPLIAIGSPPPLICPMVPPEPTWPQRL
jgi:hypothetical protein